MQRKLYRLEFRGAAIQFVTSQCCARRAREFFIPHTKPLEVFFFKAFEVEQTIVRPAHCANQKARTLTKYFS